MLEISRNFGYHFSARLLQRRRKGNSVRACKKCIEGTIGIDHTNEFTGKYGFINLRTYF